MLRRDLIYTWYNYNSLMFGHYGAPGDQEYSGHIDSLLHHLISKFNSLNNQSFLLLPTHVRHLINLKSLPSNSMSGGILIRYHLTLPPLTLVMHTLEADLYAAYSDTWCSKNTLGTFTSNNKPIFKALPTHPSHLTLPR